MKQTNVGFSLQSRDALSHCHRFENKFYRLALRMNTCRRNLTNTELQDDPQVWPTYIRKKFRDGGTAQDLRIRQFVTTRSYKSDTRYPKTEWDRKRKIEAFVKLLSSKTQKELGSILGSNMPQKSLLICQQRDRLKFITERQGMIWDSNRNYECK